MARARDRLEDHPNAAPPRDALHRSLARERRVVAGIGVLLMLVVLYGAFVVARGVVSDALRVEEQRLRVVGEETGDLLVQRYALLSAARALLLLGNRGTLPPRPVPDAASCAPALGQADTQPALRIACDYAVWITEAYTAASATSSSKTVPRAQPLLIVLADGSAAYGYALGVPENTAPAAHAGDTTARRFAAAILAQMVEHGTWPPRAPSDRSLVWFRAPAEPGFDASRLLGAAVVAKDGMPWAFAVTEIDPAQLIAAGADAPTLIGPDGVRLAGPLPPAAAHGLDVRAAALRDGLFHPLRGYGWVLRTPPLAGLGHYVSTLSWGALARLIVWPLLAVCGGAALMCALIVAGIWYWNRRYLMRAHADAQRALEGERLNRLLVQTMPVGLCIVRRDDCAILLSNESALHTLGLPADAGALPPALRALLAEPRTPATAVPATPQAAAQPAPHAPPQAPDTPVFRTPWTFERDGQPVHVEITYARATLHRQDLLVCAIADMSKRHETERLLREAKETSDAAARAKVRFFASMSHEIRTPLASLTGNLELLTLGALAPEQRARVQAMRASATNLLQIVNDVLDFSKMDVSQMRVVAEPVDVAELLGNIVLAHMPLAARQHLKFYFVTDRALPLTLRLDPVRVAQIVDNLLGNAFKFTPSGKIVLGARWRDGALELSVADSGIGMSTELRRRVFQPFTQADEERLTRARGTGLGLAICARLTELMQGSIALDSTPGVGTRVAVTLPLDAVGTDTVSGRWTLPGRHPAILCRAGEYREWLAGLFDPEAARPVFIDPDAESAPPGPAFDYLLVTDEFTPQQVQRVLADAPGPAPRIVWVTQHGPLVPTRRDDGALEVGIYSLPGLMSAVQQQPDSASVAHAVAAAAPGHARFDTLTVLIAEDHPLNRALLRDQLQTLGANVIETEDGAQALALLERHAVDIVLTDIDMPGLTGSQVLAAVRERHPALPVYAVSASARPEDVARGRAEGFTDYLAKPVALATLTRVLAASLPSAGTPAPSAAPGSAAAPDDSDAIPRFAPLPSAYRDAFVEQAARDLDALDAILPARDAAQLARWAHRVAGGLRVLGPSMLNETCEELRTLLAETAGWDDEIAEMAAAVGAELAEMRRVALQGATA